MLPFTDVLDLFSHKLTRLRARRFAFSLISPGSFECLFLWHVVRPFLDEISSCAYE